MSIRTGSSTAGGETAIGAFARDGADADAATYAAGGETAGAFVFKLDPQAAMKGSTAINIRRRL
jgi:hypothetical protein